MKKLLMVMTAIGLMALPVYAATSDATAEFLKNATIGNKFEIESSKLALKKSQDTNVRRFATQMIFDHTKAAKNLNLLLTQEQTALASKVLDLKHQSQLDVMSREFGPDFDRLYIDDQVAAHNEAIALFHDYSNNGDDKKLKDFATKTLPILKDHQSHIDNMQPKQ